MRLWTLHPRYLDPQGLVALWREGLLARAVLRGATRGYQRHPQLERFRLAPAPEAAIDAYLGAVLVEAQARGYRFDAAKLGPVDAAIALEATSGQLDHEWAHLLAKLQRRNPARSGPYSDRRYCVDRYDDAARKYLRKPASDLKWGIKIEHEGVMDLVTVHDAIAAFERYVTDHSEE